MGTHLQQREQGHCRPTGSGEKKIHSNDPFFLVFFSIVLVCPIQITIQIVNETADNYSL